MNPEGYFNNQPKAEMNLKAYLHEMTVMRQRFAYKQLPPGFLYYCAEDYVLEHGEAPTHEALTKDEQRIVKAAMRTCVARPFHYKMCFYNAQLLMLADSSRTLQYCEGFAVAGLLPVLHGWCLINNKVVDLTWRKSREASVRNYGSRIYGVIPPNFEYLGVCFSRDRVIDALTKREYTGSLIDAPDENWRELKRPRRASITEAAESV